MKIGKVSFSEAGFKAFEEMTRAEQRKFIKERMPLHLNIDKLLKGVKYAKRKKVKSEPKESKQSESTTKRSRKDNID